MQVLISKALSDSNISHDEFVLINNIQKKYYKLEVEIKDLKTWINNQIFSSIYKTMLCYCLK